MNHMSRVEFELNLGYLQLKANHKNTGNMFSVCLKFPFSYSAIAKLFILAVYMLYTLITGADLPLKINKMSILQKVSS